MNFCEFLVKEAVENLRLIWNERETKGFLCLVPGDFFELSNLKRFKPRELFLKLLSLFLSLSIKHKLATVTHLVEDCQDQGKRAKVAIRAVFHDRLTA